MEKLRNKDKIKKVYRRWNANEKYSIMIAIAKTGSKETSRLLGCVENRSENQVPFFSITYHNIKNHFIILDSKFYQ
jgi:hypothetical protein